MEGYRLERQLRNLIGLFTERILNIKTGHLELFFNDDWVSKYRIVSYGHDIEASWLIHEAALFWAIRTSEKVEPLVEYIAAAADEGLTPDGSMIYETFLDKERPIPPLVGAGRERSGTCQPLPAL